MKKQLLMMVRNGGKDTFLGSLEESESQENPRGNQKNEDVEVLGIRGTELTEHIVLVAEVALA